MIGLGSDKNTPLLNVTTIVPFNPRCTPYWFRVYWRSNLAGPGSTTAARTGPRRRVVRWPGISSFHSWGSMPRRWRTTSAKPSTGWGLWQEKLTFLTRMFLVTGQWVAKGLGLCRGGDSEHHGGLQWWSCGHLQGVLRWRGFDPLWRSCWVKLFVMSSPHCISFV